MENKWSGIRVKGCRIRNLGRPAVFLIPWRELRCRMDDGRTVEEALHEYLDNEFGAYTTSLIPQFGLWRNADRKVEIDKCCQYEVAFCGKERIAPLIKFLTNICRAIGEDCLYFKAGQYACTIEPEDE